jgi:hypothetical protein
MRHTDEARRSRDSPGSRIAVALVPAIVALTLVPAMAGAADYSWSGSAGAAPPGNWSNPANWSAGVAPVSGEAIGTLTFPALTNPACSANPPAPCGFSTNDLTGITVGTLAINDVRVSSPAYDIVGNPITLTGGLTASPGTAVSSGPVESTLGVPITLGAPQTWTVAGNPFVPGPRFGEGIFIRAPVTGPAFALTIRMSNGASLALTGDNEVGPLSVVGSSAGGSSPFVSVVQLAPSPGSATPSRLNATDGQPITVTDAQLGLDGDLGPLTLTRGNLSIGGSPTRAGVATTPAATFDGQSSAIFSVISSGADAGTDYSQLRSTGAVALGGARLGISVGGLGPGVCPAPAMGTVYTLVSTTGRLTGTFNVAEGNLLTLGGPPPCPQRLPFALRIGYHESGSPQTVTATVVPALPLGVAPGVAAAAPVSGTVLVRRRGQTAFRVLKRAALIPAGSELDTTSGRVRLFVATDRQGGTTAAELYAGRFIFRQPRTAHPRTTFVLSQPLTGCSRAGAHPRAGAAVARKHRRRHRARHVWVTEQGGSFDTRGQYVGTSVQGTTWLTGDTCTTSVVKVKDGTVTVRDLVRHRTVRLHAGQTYTARKRR